VRMAVQLFFAGLLSAIAVKLASSIDDVLWLAPFLTTNVDYKVRCQNAVVYIGVCMIQTVVALFLASSGTEAVQWLTGDEKNVWSTEKILTVSAGALLALYTVKLTYEHFTEEDSEDDGKTKDKEDKEEADGSENSEERISASEESTVASEMELGLIAKEQLLLEKEGFPEGSDESTPAAPLSPNQKQVEESISLLEESQAQNDMHKCGVHRERSTETVDKKRQQTLFMIAFIGSVDDLTLFVPMLVGHGFDWLQLMCGACIAGTTIVMLCLFIGLCKPVADVLSSIPLAAIVATFSGVLLTKAVFME